MVDKANVVNPTTSTLSPGEKCSVESAVKCATEKFATESKHLHDVVDNVVGNFKADKHGECTVPKLFIPTVAALEQVSDSVNIGRRMEHFVTDNVVAVSIGAFFGAAVTAGLAVGLMVASSLVHQVPNLYKYAVGRYQLKKQQQQSHLTSTRDLTNARQPATPSSNSSSCLDSALDHNMIRSLPLVFLQVVCNREESEQSSRLLLCLQQKLAQQSLTLQNVCRVTVYQAETQRTPSTTTLTGSIREFLEQHLSSRVILTIIPVHRLEHDWQFLLLDLVCVVG